MCGIAGIFAFPDGEPPRRHEIEAMIGALEHRGPDGEGIFLDGPVGLGHRRLSIIDLEGGDQPMESTARGSVISYNGEIYNYRELRRRLRDRYDFRTRSDTEVILALHDTEGTAGLERLRGMFALALWDREDGRLLLVRDRIGIKPLYWSRRAGRLYFGSEIKALRAVLPDLSLDPSSVNAYFARQYIGGPDTIHRDVHKLLPGRFLEVGSEGVRQTAYWEPVPSKADIEWREALDRLDERMSDAAGGHLVSDVPVGLFLSGGLDSSCLLAYAADRAESPLHTFSVGFGDSPLTETASARAVARRFGTDHHEIQVGASEMLDSLPRILAGLDQPLADYAIVPTYIMSEFASEHVKVVLSGEGADELFGGYGRYGIYAALDAASGVMPIGRTAAERLPGPPVFEDGERRALLGERFIERPDLPSEQSLVRCKTRMLAAGHLNSMLVTDMRGWLVDDLLMKIDKMGMLASLEARVPYLDHELVELVVSMPGRFKAGILRRKKILRRLARGRLPAEIGRRRKHGFTVPVGEWLAGPLRESFEDIVFGAAGERWVDPSFTRSLLKRQETRGDAGLQLWAIFIFCHWSELHA